MGSYYCAICDPGKVCNDSFPAKPFEALGYTHPYRLHPMRALTTPLVPSTYYPAGTSDPCYLPGPWGRPF